MKLKIADIWRWIAEDSNGDVSVFTHKPRFTGSYWQKVDGLIEDAGGILEELDFGPCDQSLHEILPDGTLKKHIERPELKVDERVLVRDTINKDWLRRHFVGFDEQGRILTYYNGQTSWSKSEENPFPVAWNHWKVPEDNQ